MAIVLDNSAGDVIARRRARGKDTTLFLRLERGPLRAGVPWILTVGWAPLTRPDGTVVVQSPEDVRVYVDPRVARYAQWRDLTISGARLGPWAWLVVADPFAFEHMREWERTHTDVPLPQPALATGAESTRARGSVVAEERAAPERSA